MANPARLGWLSAQAYAHRGLHRDGVPENSLAAFAAAIDAGLGIECDLRRSLDGRAMVFHDDELERLTGRTGRVSESTVGELTALNLSGTHERIPTLRDMLTLVAGRVPLLLELKTDRGRPVASLCRAVRRDLEGYAGAVAVMSFDPRVSRWFSSRQPGLVRGLVISEQNARTLSGAIRRRLAVHHARPDFLALDVTDFPSRFATARRKAGIPLLSWTVRNAALLAAAEAAGATPILEAAGVVAWQAQQSGNKAAG